MQITDMETWLLDNEDRVYGFFVYKRMFTPYEQEQKFTDESQFEDIHFTYGRIREAVNLGHGEWLLGFQTIVDDDLPAESNLDYHRLSDIQLYTYDWMQHKFDDEDETDE